MINLKKYRRFRQRGYTILGLYKIARQEGHKPDEIVEMLVLVLPSGPDSYQSGNREEIIKFMRRMEYGETQCWTCQKEFVDEPGQFCRHNCKDCQKVIDEMWEKAYDVAKESGEDLDELSLGVWFNIAAALRAKK